MDRRIRHTRCLSVCTAFLWGAAVYAHEADSTRIDLYVNGQWKGRGLLRFAPAAPARLLPQAGEGEPPQTPCYDATLLKQLGLDARNLQTQARASLQAGQTLCAPMAELFSATRADYDADARRLDVVAPQSILTLRTRRYVDPQQWDAGINAATLEYHYNGWQRGADLRAAARGQISHYLGLRAGLNLGEWQLRANATVTHSTGDGWHYRGDTLYAERDLPALQSRLTLGRTFGDAQVFERLPLTGLRLDSDDRMRPDSRRGNAPVIHGIAQSNARVRVRQLGTIIYETTVAPGPFTIDDLGSLGMHGDLLVTVTEADGSERSFSVSYTSMVELARPGVTDYTTALGRYPGDDLNISPLVAQATVRHGISENLTGYGGLTVAQNYAALVSGLAWNLPIGVLAGDLSATATRRSEPRRWQAGSSVRLRYAKYLPELGVHIGLAVSRNAHAGYFTPAQAFNVLYGRWTQRPWAQRNRLVISVNQRLPNTWGTLGVSVDSQNYWQSARHDTQYQINYTTSIGKLDLGVWLSRVRNGLLKRWENQAMLSVSLPLSFDAHTSRVEDHYLHTPDGHSNQLGFSGRFGEDNQFAYNGHAARATQQGDASRPTYGGGGALTWTSPHTTLGLTLSAEQHARQYGLSASGGIVAYADGIVLSHEIGETMAIVEAHGAAGAQVTTRVGPQLKLELNDNGRALIPHLQPYRQNEVRLDPHSLPPNVTLLATRHRVVPKAGAVALLRFSAGHDYAIVIRGRRANGALLPFAADVLDSAGRLLGQVGSAGQTLVHVPDAKGALIVSWGQRADQRCTLAYTLTNKTEQNPRQVTALCT